ncbi:MAG: hypothetical protein IAF94_06545, partial [Pirellulaceae bacterium]|nr:hypothetical protein [Pirellulaceae bacterium]
VNLFFTYHPGYKLTRDEIQQLQNNLGKNNARVEFLGTLSLSADTEVAFHHLGGSSRGGVHYLYLDGKEIHAVGDDRTKDDTLTLSLGKGDHQLHWKLTGGDFGDAQLEVNVAKSGKNPAARLDIHAPADMVAAARAPGVRQEVEYGASTQAAPAPAKATPKSSE